MSTTRSAAVDHTQNLRRFQPCDLDLWPLNPKPLPSRPRRLLRFIMPTNFGDSCFGLRSGAGKMFRSGKNAFQNVRSPKLCCYVGRSRLNIPVPTIAWLSPLPAAHGGGYHHDSTAIRLPSDCDSTAPRPFDDIPYDRRHTCRGLPHALRPK